VENSDKSMNGRTDGRTQLLMKGQLAASCPTTINDGNILNISIAKLNSAEISSLKVHRT